ncbi:MAG: hypothetical protein DWQ07_02225 [Chloroflexi bacterium]|nr:MAG: hypothetical protein DWQ07_02225 [Chloroflexota bacterium]MBL1193685.1 hypothetical protein [Chloroflexota bacterium]NOH10977.1 hypothetical protein [Chloroflexota bacterium]
MNISQRFRFFDKSIQIALAVAVGLTIGLLTVAVSPFITLALVFGLLAGVVALRRPEIVIFGILILTATILDEFFFPYVEAGPVRLFVSDVMLYALLAMLMLRLFLDSKYKPVSTRMDFPLLLFYGIGALSTAVAILFAPDAYKLANFGTLFDDPPEMIRLALPEVRIFTYYLMFFIVTQMIRTKKQFNTLLIGLMVMAVITGIFMVIQSVVGIDAPFLAGRVETLSTGGQSFANITRVLPPGQSLMLLGFIISSSILVLQRFRFWNVFIILQWAVMAAGVIFTFNRTFWVASALAFLLLILVVRWQERSRIVGWGYLLTFGLVVLAVFAFSSPDSQVAAITDAVIDRLSTITSIENISNDQSFRWRDVEYEGAFESIASRPFLGIGIGAEYRDWNSLLDNPPFYDGRTYIHNGHMWLLMKTGVIGYLAFLLLGGTYVFRAFRKWQSIENELWKAVVIGGALTFIGLIPAAIANPVYMQPFWTPVFGIMFAANEFIYTHSEPSEDSIEKALN